MKYLFVGLICGLFLMNCQNKEGTVSKESSVSNLDTIEINKLPFGNELLIKKFINNDELGFLDDSETKLLEFEDSSFLSYYEKFFKNSSLPIDKFYKYQQKNILDFGLNYIEPIDSINTYKGYYSLAKRLPDIMRNSLKIRAYQLINFININKRISLISV